MIKNVMVDGSEAMKLMVDGVKVWERSGLPTRYTKCEYLESSGAQYIDTGIVDDGQTDFEISFAYTAGGQGYPSVFGARITVDYIVSLMYFNDNELYYSTVGIISVNDIRAKHTYHFYANHRYWEVLNEGITSDKDICRTTNLSVYLFGLNWNNKRLSKTKIYGFHAVKNNTVIQNLIPALDSSGVPCMYDTVSKQPFYNHGTGEFLYELA